MVKKITFIISFLFLISGFLFFAKSIKAACIPECGPWSAETCSSCVNCSRTCTKTRDCTRANCTEYTDTSTRTVSCDSNTLDCDACNCSGRTECINLCTGAVTYPTCARPAYCNDPTPTPTPAPNCSNAVSTCTNDNDCIGSSDPNYGDTCIITKDPTICYCTTLNTGDINTYDGTWTCEVYRDAYYVNGVCYNQWKCCLLDDLTRCVYQILQTCVGGTETPAPSGSSASCNVSLSPAAGTVEVGNTIGIEAVVSALNGTVDRVDFGMSEADIFSLSPTSDSSSLYQTTGTGLSEGTISIGASVVMGGAITCSTQPSIFSVVIPGAWWQVKDADVTSGGQIYSYIPMACSLPVCSPYFGLEGEGGFPGVPVSFGDAFFGEGDASEVGWVVNSGSALRKGYSYSLFERQIPVLAETTTVPVGGNLSDLLTSGGVESSGAYWFMYDGGEGGLDLELGEDLDLGDRKVVLFVNNADLMIKGNISLTNGSGFLMVIVGQNEDGEKGNIYFDTTIGGLADDAPEIEGLFFADNQIYTGETNSQLHIRGVIAGIGGINLQRDLDDDSSTPAEFIEYAPDLILNIPPSLKISKFSWKEVAP